MLAATLLNRRSTIAYVFRPCIVAGPEARTMLQAIPYFRLGEAMPDVVVRLLGSVPALKPVIPDPGARFQLVHEDDVARAFVAGVRGVGEPGPYNLAGGGTLTFSHLADGARLVLGADPEAGGRGHRRDRHAPAVHPESVGWLHSVRKPVLMKTDRARKLLKWRPQHTARKHARGAWCKAQRERELPTAQAHGSSSAPRGTARRSPPRPSRAGSAASCRRPSRPPPAPGCRPRARRPATAASAGPSRAISSVR